MLTDYIQTALRQAQYELTEDGRYFGRIAECEGVWGDAATLEGCREEVRGALESWVIGGLRHGDTLPVLNGIDLNARQLVDA